MKNALILMFSLLLSLHVFANDSDSDGYSDEKEILLGTDPNVNEFKNIMPEYTGLMSPYLKAPLYQSHSEKETQSVVTPDGNFLIGLRRYSLKIARINTNGSLSQIQTLPTSGVLPIDHNDMDIYANYHLEVSPNGKNIAVYNPTLPRNKRAGVYDSNIELYEIIQQCSNSPMASLVLKKRFVLPNQTYGSSVFSLTFSSDSRYLYSSSFDGLNVYRVHDDSLDLVQNTPGSFGFLAAIDDKLASSVGMIFNSHIGSGYLLSASSMEGSFYNMSAASSITSSAANESFWLYREGDDFFDGAYARKYDLDGNLNYNVTFPLGSDLIINDYYSIVSMQGEEYGSIRVYSNQGEYIGNSYRAMDQNLSNIEEVASTPDGKWLFITTNLGTYTYKGAQIAKLHGDADSDGVLDVSDYSPLDPNSY